MEERMILDCSVVADDTESSSDDSDFSDEDTTRNKLTSAYSDQDSNHGSSGDEGDRENTDKVREKLVETGQMERLKDLMERRLSSIGWRITMLTSCRAVVQAQGGNVPFEMLFQNLRHMAQEIVPEEVKEEVLQKIKYCYQSETEDN